MVVGGDRFAVAGAGLDGGRLREELLRFVRSAGLPADLGEQQDRSALDDSPAHLTRELSRATPQLGGTGQVLAGERHRRQPEQRLGLRRAMTEPYGDVAGVGVIALGFVPATPPMGHGSERVERARLVEL